MKIIAFFILIVCSVPSFSQEKDPEVYTIVEEQAEYPGGIQELYKFINNNIVFPESAKQDSSFIACKVFVKFIINEDGVLNNAQIIKECNGCPDCDKEALRVVKTMPNWKPGRQSGIPVKVYYNLPIKFKAK